MTRKFYTTSFQVVEELRSNIGDHTAENVRAAITVALMSSEEVLVENWVNNLTLKKPAKQKLLKDLQKVIPDGQFVVDPKVADGFTKKRVFKGGFGVKLTIEASQFDKVVKKREQRQGYVEVVLHVPDFHEVER